MGEHEGGTREQDYSFDAYTEPDNETCNSNVYDDFSFVEGIKDIEKPIEAFGGRGILKTRRDGYDGKGQVRLEAGDDFEAACKALAHAPAILEAWETNKKNPNDHLLKNDTTLS